MRSITVAALRGRAARLRGEAFRARAVAAEWRRRRRPRAALDFEDWVARRQLRGGGFPDAWRTDPGLEVADPCRVAALVHVYYPQLLPELLSALAAVPVEFDLIVTNASGEPVDVAASAPARARTVRVLEVANLGRDIWPMAQVVNAGLLDPYELVLKVHTKASPWRAGHEVLAGSGDQWRTDLLRGVLGDEASVRRILSAFAAQPDLGLVTADGNLVGEEHWGGDFDNTRELLRRVELPVERRGLCFAGGSCYWVRAFVLQGLRGLQLSAADFEAEAGQIDGTTAHAIERAVGILTGEAGLRLTTPATLGDPAGDGWQRYRAGAPRTPRARVVPFYLPQFHPSAENDRWWGRGFTEWANVAAARPVYRGHNQPNLPGELGFYDLRLDDVRREQGRLATEHGLAGFMYYYYWFAGRRLLDRPIQRLAASDEATPFCLMWANENWTRRWDGREADVLVAQDYARVPAETFVDDVVSYLRDPRYLRVDGKAVLAVYRIGQLPDPAAVVASWRASAAAAGAGELLLLAVDVAREFDGLRGDASALGLDGTLGFPPHGLRWDWHSHAGLGVDRRFGGNLLSYRGLVAEAQRRLLGQPADHHPGVMVDFDNTARRQWAPDLWYGANPYTFRRWLAAACASVADRDPQRRLVFVNAWNEWAESAVLEPSARWGRSYLQAVRDVLYA